MSTVKDEIENAPAVEFEPDGLSEAETALLDELAGLSPILYARRRNAAAEKLGIGGPALDREIALRRPHNGGDAGQGRALDLFEPELWPDPVDGDVLLDQIIETFQRFLILPEHAAEAMALWVVFAHAIDAADVAPRLALTSPVKRCAKTTALNVIGRLVPRALPASNISPAAVFRAIEAARPTLLIDEADTFLKTSDELRGVLNSGHSRDSASVVRVVGDNLEVRQFSTWAAIAVALIGKLPDTLEDRSIAIEMKRKKPGEIVEKFRRNRLGELADLASMAARWAADNHDALRTANPMVPAELHDRAADNWEPLFAIADKAGGDWPERARRAAVALSGSTEEDTARVMVLADIKAIFAEQSADRLPSTTLCEELAKLETRPWPEWRNGKPITARQLATLLRPHGIKPSSRREGGEVYKGYVLADFEEAFTRYLPPTDRLHGYNPQEPSTFGDSDRLHGIFDVTDKNDEKARETATCNRVTDRIGEPPADGQDEATEWTG